LVYQKYFKAPAVPLWQKLLTFEIKNNNLTPETAETLKQKFNQIKEKLISDPNDINTWLYLGLLKKMVNDYEGARDVWLYITQKWPQDSTAYGNLGDLYTFFLNEPQKAEAAYKTAIQNDPKNYNFYLGLADLYRYKYPEGDAKYEQTLLDALNKFPDEVNLIGPLAVFYYQTNQVDKAIPVYEKLVKLSPDNETAKQDLAELRKRKQK